MRARIKKVRIFASLKGENKFEFKKLKIGN